ncbi:MAG: ACT domain-containing protein [Gammaproteobacteria bacterium]|nr:MAG: ACT domain-containing protein [Gammaproteobacteria bacterium]
MKNKIATLGPTGTFSDLAARRYLRKSGEEAEITYYPSIKAVFAALGKECGSAIVPIENFSEGYIPLVLDNLINDNIFIKGDMLLPISFSYIGNVVAPDEIRRIFVQFVAEGQCAGFLEELQQKTKSKIEIIETQSNIQSLQLLKGAEKGSGAIVPSSAISESGFAKVIENINDYKDNATRFLILSPHEVKVSGGRTKSSLIVFDDDDKPGMLESVLSSFSKREINLTSIVSRPTKRTFGKYHFFIDLEGAINNKNICDALKEITTHFRVRFLGSYNNWGE